MKPAKTKLATRAARSKPCLGELTNYRRGLSFDD